MHQEYQYLNLLKKILDQGSDKEVFLAPEVKQQYIDQTKELPVIRSTFGEKMEFDLSQGEFPLLTTKKTFFKGIVHELLWLISGSSSIKYLVDNGVHIWDEWAYKKYKELHPNPVLSQKEYIEKVKTDNKFAEKYADLGNVYGKQWRSFEGVNGAKADQLAWVIDGLKNKPFRKSYVVSAWNPNFIYAMCKPQNENKRMALPPCHTTFQFTVNNGKLNCLLFQRSGDMFLGIPFNIASYSLLTLMVAQVTGIKPGKFVHVIGDAHIYSDHFSQVKEQLTREPLAFPQVKLNKTITNIDDFKFDDLKLKNYNSHPAIKAPVTNVGGF